MVHAAVTYSLVGIDDLLDRSKPFRRLAFLPARRNPLETLSQEHRGRKVVIHETLPARDAKFASGYWYVHYVEKAPTVTATVQPTNQILRLLDHGRPVLVISGPFETEEAAQHDMDLRWEAPE
jgi:hypothetical protein